MPATEKPTHYWYYLSEGLLGESDEGPFEESQLVVLVKAGKIKLKTKLRSPTRTKDQLIFADSIPKLAAAINQYNLEKAEEKKANAVARKAERKENAAQKRELKAQQRQQKEDAARQMELAAHQQQLDLERSRAEAELKRPQPVVQQPTTIIINQGHQKSKMLAFLLTFFFGPLGMLYSTVIGGLCMTFLGFIVIPLCFVGVGLLMLPFYWIACLVWAVAAAG